MRCPANSTRALRWKCLSHIWRCLNIALLRDHSRVVICGCTPCEQEISPASRCIGRSEYIWNLWRLPSAYTQFARRFDTNISASFDIWHVWNKFNNNLRWILLCTGLQIETLGTMFWKFWQPYAQTMFMRKLFFAFCTIKTRGSSTSILCNTSTITVTQLRFCNYTSKAFKQR